MLNVKTDWVQTYISVSATVTQDGPLQVTGCTAPVKAVNRNLFRRWVFSTLPLLPSLFSAFPFLKYNFGNFITAGTSISKHPAVMVLRLVDDSELKAGMTQLIWLSTWQQQLAEKYFSETQLQLITLVIEFNSVASHRSWHHTKQSAVHGSTSHCFLYRLCF